ncbi:MAG: hypothetical protein ABSG31_17530 [Tepidisphaeraceae bacterium]|jgi:TolB-like protein
MRTLILILTTALFFTGTTLADGPTTAPSEPKVLIFPFQQVDAATSHQWVSQALQEDMAAQAGNSGYVQPVAMPKPLTTADAPQAITAGQEAGASAVIFGTYQTSGENIRVTGQMVRVPDGKVLVTLQANGITLDIFKVEDILGSEMNPAIAQTFGPPQPVVTYGQQPNIYTSETQAAEPSTVYISPSTVYVQPTVPDYTTAYPYDGYPYDYGFYSPGIVVGGGFYGGYYGGYHNHFGGYPRGPISRGPIFHTPAYGFSGGFSGGFRGGGGGRR